jgi:integrase
MSPKRNALAPHMKRIRKKNGAEFFYYRMPDGSLEPLRGTKQEAIEAANALTAALRSSGSLVQRVLDIAANPDRPRYDPRNPPMCQVIDEYREQLREEFERGKIGARTFEEKCYKLTEYEETFGKKKCQSMATFDLAQHIRDKTGNVQQKHVPLMKAMFRYAVSAGYRDSNPANELQPREPEARKRHRHTWEGFKQIRSVAPEWLQRTMDIALYSLQRRGDLVLMHMDAVDQQQKTIDVLQQKTRNYNKPVYIQIKAGESLWSALKASITSDVPCPYLIHYRPQRMSAKTRAAKEHPFAVLPGYLSKQFTKYRDQSGAYAHLPPAERPTFHDIRALGILMYFKAKYPLDYIMALAGHAKAATTEHYLEGHEERKPIAVNAGLSLDQVDVKDIDWRNENLPPELAKLIDEPDD